MSTSITEEIKTLETVMKLKDRLASADIKNLSSLVGRLRNLQRLSFDIQQIQDNPTDEELEQISQEIVKIMDVR